MGGILHVCTGNQARSPFAERLMIHEFWQHFGPAAHSVLITSAGTQGPAGVAMQPMALAELEQRGVDGSTFRSRQLSGNEARHAHIVLTATRSHRDQVVGEAPLALRDKTFTWREIAWLLDGVRASDIPGTYVAEKVLNLPWVAVQRRGFLTPLPPHRFDVDDPMGGTKKDYRRASGQIAEAIDAIVAALKA
ncbi:low molecular weight phosphatase family protein [Paractinoplanes maris]|uniref:arsenate-mycothiol transferase ArsC n=1 Tax=Paractinoplanes maris TaxID=1734446 RepID=UPI0020204664|nr:hypothetical protein [Actinoplanes maris]